MKRLFPLLGIASLFLAIACGPTHVVVQDNPPPPPPAPAPPPAITYQTFYDALSPYGQWFDYPGMGYVWIPNAGPDFKPYGTAGQWVYSDEGWTWVSDYSWGWAPFHYGRWFFDDNYGWCWVPGYQWAPAWVSWRTSPDYYGWAPMGPGVGVSMSVEAYNPPPRVWCFVPRQYVAQPHVNNYYVNENRNVTIINNTTVIRTTVINNTTINNTTINNTTVNNNTVNNNRGGYVAGPPRAEVEGVTHTSIRPVSFREGNTPGSGQLSNGQLTVYRPPVRTPPPAGGGQSAPAPARVTPFRPGTPPTGGNRGNGGGGQPTINSNQPNGNHPNGNGQGAVNNGNPNGNGAPANDAQGGFPRRNPNLPPAQGQPAGQGQGSQGLSVGQRPSNQGQPAGQGSQGQSRGQGQSGVQGQAGGGTPGQPNYRRPPASGQGSPGQPQVAGSGVQQGTGHSGQPRGNGTTGPAKGPAGQTQQPNQPPKGQVRPGGNMPPKPVRDTSGRHHPNAN